MQMKYSTENSRIKINSVKSGPPVVCQLSLLVPCIGPISVLTVLCHAIKREFEFEIVCKLFAFLEGGGWQELSGVDFRHADH